MPFRVYRQVSDSVNGKDAFIIGTSMFSVGFVCIGKSYTPAYGRIRPPKNLDVPRGFAANPYTSKSAFWRPVYYSLAGIIFGRMRSYASLSGRPNYGSVSCWAGRLCIRLGIRPRFVEWRGSGTPVAPKNIPPAKRFLTNALQGERSRTVGQNWAKIGLERASDKMRSGPMLRGRWQAALKRSFRAFADSLPVRPGSAT